MDTSEAVELIRYALTELDAKLDSPPAEWKQATRQFMVDVRGVLAETKEEK